MGSSAVNKTASNGANLMMQTKKLNNIDMRGPCKVDEWLSIPRDHVLDTTQWMMGGSGGTFAPTHRKMPDTIPNSRLRGSASDARPVKNAACATQCQKSQKHRKYTSLRIRGL